VYAGVPPDADTDAVPLLPALQLTLAAVAVLLNGAGCVIETVCVFVHPLLSVTTTV
jgi:hypothetical protein